MVEFHVIANTNLQCTRVGALVSPYFFLASCVAVTNPTNRATLGIARSFHEVNFKCVTSREEATFYNVDKQKKYVQLVVFGLCTTGKKKNTLSKKKEKRFLTLPSAMLKTVSTKSGFSFICFTVTLKPPNCLEIPSPFGR